MPDDMGPLPVMTERDRAFIAANRELFNFLIDLRERHGLTRAEELAALSNMLRDRTCSALAAERRK